MLAYEKDCLQPVLGSVKKNSHFIVHFASSLPISETSIQSMPLLAEKLTKHERCSQSRPAVYLFGG
jgi:hypothetical protein